MAFLDIILVGLVYLWDLFKDWAYIFISPIENPVILWIIIPIWANWFFAEFFQEKKGTSFGNAISNGVIPMFVAIDWTRYLTGQIIDGKLSYSFSLVLKYALCALALAYGLIIVYYGIKGRKFVLVSGRIRETTYLLVMFSPVIYGILDLAWKHILVMILFFPLYYYIIEWIDRLTPDPNIYKYDEGKENIQPPINDNLNSGYSEFDDKLDRNIKF
jgi:hypothetical protein